jgi:acetate kinase
MRILTINSGSSSIKFSLYELDGSGAPEARELSGAIERIGSPDASIRVNGPGVRALIDERRDIPDHGAAVRALIERLERSAGGPTPNAVGHRIVHGGAAYREPHRLSPAVLSALRSMIPLAPDHLPHEIDAIEAMAHAYPDTPQVACFDTDFHRHMPRVAQLYALPRRLRDDGIQRYGFHGLSYEYIVGELRRENALGARTIIAHLGNGASLAAVRDGIGVDTTMGFTPTGGLVMSTRTGDLDPNVLLYLLREKQLSIAAVDALINKSAGLLALSGLSGDMKDLLDAEVDHAPAAEAIAVFCYHTRQAIGAMATALGGMDLLVFTAGIGEHAPSIRERVCDGLQFLGISLDPARNNANATIISADRSAVTVRVLPTNEELTIARHTYLALTTAAASSSPV